MTIFKKTKSNLNPDRDRFLETVRSHLGYKTRPSGLSEFAVQTGYKGEAIPWSGAFLDVCARDSNVFMPACIYTPSGLAEFSADGRIVMKPEPGDIVFYSFPTAEQFGMPHCGVVSNTDDFEQTGMFTAIEAQVNSGLPKASQSKTGIFERVRWKYEVIAFARPDFSRRPATENTKKQTDSVLIKLRSVQPGRQNSSVQTVQKVLAQVAGLKNETPSVFDEATQLAYSRWQRWIGFVYPDCTGVPDRASLRLLGQISGMFSVDSEN
jgi:hypothetical protein